MGAHTGGPKLQGEQKIRTHFSLTQARTPVPATVLMSSCQCPCHSQRAVAGFLASAFLIPAVECNRSNNAGECSAREHDSKHACGNSIRSQRDPPAVPCWVQTMTAPIFS